MTKFKTFTPTLSETILAIDPGFDRIGLAVMKLERDKPKLLFSECFKTDSKEARPERLFSIGRRAKEVIKKWQPETLAIETLFFNTNITSAIGVAEARGIIIYEAIGAGMTISEYGPQTIKIAVTGYGKAAKRDVASMLKKLLGVKKTVKNDDE